MLRSAVPKPHVPGCHVDLQIPCGVSGGESVHVVISEESQIPNVSYMSPVSLNAPMSPGVRLKVWCSSEYAPCTVVVNEPCRVANGT